MANLSNINGKFVVEQTTGFVGIGTTDPAYLLHVNSSDVTNGTRIIIENTNGSGKKYGLLSDNTGVFTVRDITAGADRFSISTLGNATFAGSVTTTGLTVQTGTYHKVITSFPSTYKTNLQIGQQLNISNDAITDTVTFANTGAESVSEFIFTIAGNEKLKIDGSGTTTITNGTNDNTLLLLNGARGRRLRVEEHNTGNGGIAITSQDDNETGTTNSSNRTILLNASGGNVGIGTTSPGQQLTLSNSSSSKIQIKGHSASNGLFLGMDSAVNAQLWNAENGYIRFATNDTERIRITSAGFLQVVDGAVTLNKSDGSFITFDYNGSTKGYIGSERQVVTGGSQDNMAFSSLAELSFATGSSLTKRMSITSRGEVGIGITPNVNSNVVNVIQLGKGMTLLGNANDDRATMAANLYLDTGTAFRYVMDGYAGRFSIEDGNMIWGTAGSGTLGAVATVSTKMTLLNNGNVGIGTTSPGYKLSVANGSTRIVSINYQDNLNTIMSHAGSPNYGLEALTIRGDYIAFYTDYDTSHYQGLERMRITSTGLTTIKRTGITGVAKNDMILQIGYEGNNGQNNLIGFGYNGGTNIPAYIGFTTTSGGGSTQGDLVFATRGVTTDTAPTERMRITSGGQLQLQGSSSSLAKSTTQTEWAYIPGNTPGASLMAQNPSGMSSASAGYHIVYGTNNSSPYQAFIDVITYQCGSSTNVTVVSSTTLNNSPGSRSYSKNSSAVFLNISGAANYNCNIKTTFINLPH